MMTKVLCDLDVEPKIVQICVGKKLLQESTKYCVEWISNTEKKSTFCNKHEKVRKISKTVFRCIFLARQERRFQRRRRRLGGRMHVVTRWRDCRFFVSADDRGSGGHWQSQLCR